MTGLEIVLKRIVTVKKRLLSGPSVTGPGVPNEKTLEPKRVYYCRLGSLIE